MYVAFNGVFSEICVIPLFFSGETVAFLHPLCELNVK